jgi:hypothetical protein
MASALHYKLAIFHQPRRALIMAEDDSTGTNMIWAVAMIIIVAIIAGALYFSGALSGRRSEPTQKIDVEVSAPSR